MGEESLLQSPAGEALYEDVSLTAAEDTSIDKLDHPNVSLTAAEDTSIDKLDHPSSTKDDKEDANVAVGEMVEYVSDDSITDDEEHKNHTPSSQSSVSDDETHDAKLVRPSEHLPRPEAPPGLTRDRSTGPEEESHLNRSMSAGAGVPALAEVGRYIRDRGSSFSAAIVKRISSLKETDEPATEFNISGLKVIVRAKSDCHHHIEGIKGRVSFFSRSGCRDCGAVRAFFREQGLVYVEINVDVFPERETELVDRTGSAAVPAIFFNEKLLGGLVALNSLRNSGEFERRLKEMAGRRCPETAPRVPVYGFDCEEGEWRMDAMAGVVRVLRQRLPIGDRLLKMKIVRNCFSGSDMVEALIQQLDCGRKKAVEVAKELARKHFIHHVFRENDFEDGHHQFYRFLEHDPAIPKCFNFRGSTNDDEPKKASEVGQRITKLMSAILEAFTTDDRRRLDYACIGSSEEFRRYVNMVQDLQRVDIFSLSPEEKTAFFLNLYNAMVIHAIIRIGRPAAIDRRAFFSEFQYIVGGYHYSLTTIKNGILRSNRRQPYSLIKPFGTGDRRLEVALPKLNPLIHFGLCNGTRSSPTVRFFSVQGVDLELRYAAREFFLGGGVEVDLERRNVHLTRIIKWYAADFGQDKDILKWILNYLDATKAGLLTHLLNDGGPINIVYQNFDWSLNS